MLHKLLDASWRSTTSGEEEERGKKQGTLIGRKLLMENTAVMELLRVPR